MSPIRLGLIGLSSSAKTSWASGAHLPYLLSSKGQEKYKIVALCNSSEDAAKRAIEAYKLPSDTKAYGSPQALADDADVDLVVSCTRVDVHHETILPSVKAGKSVFVEWPLAQDVKHAKELTEAAAASGSRTIVGLQGRFAPVHTKISELLNTGRIGKVLSSEFVANGGTNDRERIPTSLVYFGQRAIGGNVLTIGYGHLFDQIQHVLGDFNNLRGQLQIQRPEFKLFDPTSATKEVVGSATSEIPDLVINTATLSGSDTVQEGATVLTRFRRGQPFKGDPYLVWTINGEKGEIRLRAQSGTALHAMGYDGPVTIEVHDFESDKVDQIDWEWEAWQQELPVVSRSVAKLYEGFATKEQVPGFQDALKRHEQLEATLDSWSA